MFTTNLFRMLCCAVFLNSTVTSAMDSSTIKLAAVAFASGCAGMACGAWVIKGSYDHKIEHMQIELNVLKTQKEEQARALGSINAELVKLGEKVQKLDRISLKIEDDFVTRVLASSLFKSKLTDWFNDVDTAMQEKTRLQMTQKVSSLLEIISQTQRDNKATVESLLQVRMAEWDKILTQRFNGIDEKTKYLLIKTDELSARMDGLSSSEDDNEDVGDDESHPPLETIKEEVLPPINPKRVFKRQPRIEKNINHEEEYTNLNGIDLRGLV